MNITQLTTCRQGLAVLGLGLLLSATPPTQAQTLLRVDASTPVAEPRSDHLHMGSSLSPVQGRLGVNSRYLTLDGQPWLPVMGEFHYSRVPEASWPAELTKMKAAGLDAVSTYIFWNHHEEVQGVSNWQGNRNLRRFVQLAAQQGLKVMVRIGPWAHGEARYGGMPDWVVDAMPTRRNDPQYLHFVERHFAAIAQQLRGLLWKDGGPVIGVQIENEYNRTGPGRGAEHIATLKALARKVGIDVPLYTVTGWDGAQYPTGEVLPVFGSYPGEPWGTSATELPPYETYVFRFHGRVNGDLGAQTAASLPGTADSEMDRTPFLGAEYGAGLPVMYRRRPVIAADDAGAMLPVQIGSGVNLLGYYMFKGGRNPVGRTTLEESTLTGAYNDVPRINYDFTAPIGPDGQERPAMSRLRPVHAFLHDFGARLAPMVARQPEQVPSGYEDLATPRWAVRSLGDSGFLFFSNHVRQYAMAAQKAVQFEVRLPGGDLKLPSRPVDIADGAYFIWPFNFDMDGTRLDYATAMPIARLDAGRDGIVYVFTASPGMAAEFKLGAQRIEPAPGKLVSVGRSGARDVSLLLLSAEQARQAHVFELGGQRRLVLSEQQLSVEGGQLQLRSMDDPHVRAAIFPALARARVQAPATSRERNDGVFQWIEAELPARTLQARLSLIREAEAVPPVEKGGLSGAAVQPRPEIFRTAGAWRIELPQEPLKGLDDALLEIDFTGDIGRLFAGTEMLDDWYYNGQAWQVGLRANLGKLKQPWSVTVLPLRADAPIYIDRAHRPDFKGQQQIALVQQVRIRPIYRVSIAP
jgi:hypothetical protein